MGSSQSFAAMDRFRRPVFRVMRTVDIGSWHLLGTGENSPFLRNEANALLRMKSKASDVELSSSAEWQHIFSRDRTYYLEKLKLPGSFEMGLATVSQKPYSARLVLGIFYPGAENPSVLYTTDRIAVDAAGR